MSKISLFQLASYAVDQIDAGVKTAKVSQKLAAYLLDARQTRDMPKLMRAVESELARRGCDQVTITSVHAVADDVKQQLATLLGAKNPSFTEVLDPSAIGGVKAVSGENQIDLTVKSKLNKFKSIIAEGAK